RSVQKQPSLVLRFVANANAADGARGRAHEPAGGTTSTSISVKRLLMRRLSRLIRIPTTARDRARVGSRGPAGSLAAVVGRARRSAGKVVRAMGVKRCGHGQR